MFVAATAVGISLKNFAIPLPQVGGAGSLTLEISSGLVRRGESAHAVNGCGSILFPGVSQAVLARLEFLVWRTCLQDMKMDALCPFLSVVIVLRRPKVTATIEGVTVTVNANTISTEEPCAAPKPTPPVSKGLKDASKPSA